MNSVWEGEEVRQREMEPVLHTVIFILQDDDDASTEEEEVKEDGDENQVSV